MTAPIVSTSLTVHLTRDQAERLHWVEANVPVPADDLLAAGLTTPTYALTEQGWLLLRLAELHGFTTPA